MLSAFEPIAPWYHAQIAADRNRFAEIEALCKGREPPEVDEFSRRAAALFTTMTTDPDLFRAALEYIGTLTPLQEILARPEVEQRLATAMETLSPAQLSEIPGPNRDQLFEIAK